MKGATRHIITVGFWVMTVSAFCQCWEDIPLIRKDTILSTGIVVIEPKPGHRARVTFEPIPIVETIREDFLVSGSWTKATNTSDPFLNKDCYFSNTVGATLAMNVQGDSLQVWTAIASHHGEVGITLNNGLEKIVNLKSATRKDNVKIYSTPLPIGINSIRFRVAGNGYTVLDYVKLFE